MDNSSEIKRLLRQQAAIAKFGSYALGQSDLHKVLTEAARVCAQGLAVPFCKICKYRPEENDLLIVAGFGWQDGVIGKVISRADLSSPQGRAFMTGEPSICNDLRSDSQFILPPFYAKHGIVSTIDILIKGNSKPYGVLEIDSDTPQKYDEQDIIFLTGFANVLAEAVVTSDRSAALEAAIEQMKILVTEKENLLSQKKVLGEELQHRVRNNLQLIYGMLTRVLERTKDEPGRRDIKAIARRVSTLAQVYDHLLGVDIARTTDFGGYLLSLCRSLEEIQGGPSNVKMTCSSELLTLDIDVVTALGIIVAELVTNSYDHAFQKLGGKIDVSVRRDPDDANAAVLTISDDGRGFEVQPGSKRYGLGLIRRLAEQIRGRATVAADKGTVWTIHFPLPQPA